MNLTDEQFETLLYTLRDLSHGGQAGPMGMEAVCMALGGKSGIGEDSVARGLHDVADAIRELSEAIQSKERT